MSLRRRTLLIVGLLMLAALVAAQLVGRWLVYPSFLELEQDQAKRNAERAVQVIDRELALLAPSCEDWAYWDDTREFVRNDNQAYRDANLTEASQLSLNMNLLAFYDRDRRRIWARGLDLSTMRPFEADEFSLPTLPASHPLLSHEDRPKVRFGLLQTSRGPLLAVSAPILDSRRQGPSAGTLVMGRFLDDTAVKRIAQQTLLEIELRPSRATGPIAMPADAGADGIALPHSEFRYEATGRVTRAITTLADIDGRPLLDLVIVSPRDVSARGRRALQLSMKAVAIAGLAIAAILAWLLNAGIVQPIVAITRHARDIGRSGDLDARLSLRRGDEIGALGQEFDRMLDRLRESRLRLSQENYRAGANEMAGGLIDDLRRAIEPLREHVDQPLKLLDRAHTAGMQLLLQELAGTEPDHHRRTEIVQQLLHQTGELADLLAEARGELRGIRKELEQSQSMVNEYSRYLRAPKTPEPVPIAPLIEQAIRKLPPAARQSLEVEVDASIQRMPDVEASREILQQVINVLLAQATERAAGPGRASEPRRLRISAMEFENEGRAQVHLRFEDNRSALETEAMLAVLGQRGGMEEKTGLSLGWAENAVSSMSGRLFGQASPTFDGLTLHLQLPRAKARA